MVLCSDIPNNRIMGWSAAGGFSAYRTGVEFTNGHTLDLEGRLVSCSHGNRRIERTEHDGSIVTVVDRYQGRRLNSPNDLVVKSDGTIWFSDPPYGIASDWEGHKADREMRHCYVFRFDPADGSLVAVTDVIEEPNGLAFSPDESLLYVSDTSAAFREDGTGNHHIMCFDVIGAGPSTTPPVRGGVAWAVRRVPGHHRGARAHQRRGRHPHLLARRDPARQDPGA